ncbi:hypothetical protein B0I35DRAFT_477703 [Stachybotrys elegans]|uniref:Uncharacterized protein n=1 Tax=Stachybotrys elegans TaxID=80388 RepID=A0A8K0SSH4_9HYPO|nr:hypothetical protein B0I35DRAFT_477703 [Stachybotrys elegans]
MEQTPASASGADAIRSLKNDDAIFQAFDGYPWKKDPMFTSGLYAILGNPGSVTSQESLRDMAVHARIFYYAQRIGVTIDFARYQSWLAQHPNHQAPDVLPDEYREQGKPAQDAAAALTWQQAAPKADLYVDRKAAPQATEDGEPNYPMGFAEMLRLLQEGKPIPGIKQIPNTVVRDPTVKPVGSRPVPKKPWEKDVAPASVELETNKTLDADFPPIEAAESAATEAQAAGQSS